MLRLLLGSFLLIICLNTEANTKIVISLPPADRELFIPPSGYAQCHLVPSGYSHGIWVSQHRICNYSSYRGKSAWVSGAWQCVNVHHRHKTCQRWEWVPSHWDQERITTYRSSPMFVTPPPYSVVVAPVHHYKHGW